MFWIIILLKELLTIYREFTGQSAFPLKSLGDLIYVVIHRKEVITVFGRACSITNPSLCLTVQKVTFLHIHHLFYNKTQLEC